MVSGEEKAWEILSGLDPFGVSKRAVATYDPEEGLYVIRCFSLDVKVAVRERKIFCDGPLCALLLERLGYFSRLSILWYLVSAKEIQPAGRLINPVNLKGGQLFFRGTHVLPLDRLAEKYRDIEAFFARGKEIGGEVAGYGDAALRLFPFPRIPVVLILWREDEEFPARADLLFDTSCECHLALDILWSAAMMTILMMM